MQCCAGQGSAVQCCAGTPNFCPCLEDSAPTAPAAAALHNRRLGLIRFLLTAQGAPAAAGGRGGGRGGRALSQAHKGENEARCAARGPLPVAQPGAHRVLRAPEAAQRFVSRNAASSPPSAAPPGPAPRGVPLPSALPGPAGPCPPRSRGRPGSCHSRRAAPASAPAGARASRAAPALSERYSPGGARGA